MSVDIRGSSASPSMAAPGFPWRTTADQRAERPKAPIVLAPLPPRPLVTVLIANFNYAGYVGRAIESVLAQSYEFLEVIVCDDGSTDNSRDVIAAYAERDIRVRLVSRPNGGMAAAWNTAFEASGGDIICLLDADDEFLPCKIESVVRRFTERANAGLVLHPLIVIDGTGQEIQQIPVLTKVEEGWIADRVLHRGGRWRTVPTSGIAFRRDLATYLFPIPEARFRWGADGFVVTLLPLLTEVAVVDGAFAYYRVHGGNDLGSFGFNAGVADRVVELVQATTAGVNERLAECGYDRVRIDPNRNLGLAEYALLRALSENESSRLLVRRCAALLRALFASDLYGRPQKLLKGIFFSISVLLPVSARKRWIGIALGHSRQKHAIQRLVSVLGGGR